MRFWMNAKLTTIMIAAVAVATIAGAGAVLAAQGLSGASAASHTADGSAQQGNQFQAQGVIQQVTFNQGTTKSGNLVFVPQGQQAPVNVFFTTATQIEIGADNQEGSQDESATETQQSTLHAGMSAKVEGALHADSSVIASVIQANAKDAKDDDHHTNNDQSDHPLVSVIQSVDQGAQTVVLLPDGKTTPVTIAFDTRTTVEDEHDDGNHGVPVAGAHVQVEMVTRADGSLYAKAMAPAAPNQGEDDQNGENGGADGSGHHGQPTPTPGSGD